jgi:homoserine/homoserine lactone efflux protein
VAVGLGSLLAASVVWFEAVRAVGVLYLTWLAVQLWRNPPLDVQAAVNGLPSQQAALRRSLWVALSNPKALLFFAAFLPQFVDPFRPLAPQYAALGTVFLTIDVWVMLVYAAAGRQAVLWLSHAGLRRLNRGCAVGMGVLAAVLANHRRHSA